MLKLEYLDVISEPTPDEVKRICHSMGYTLAEYSEWLQEAIRRESAAMFDALGYVTKPNPEATKGWGVIMTILSEQIGYGANDDE